MTTPNLTHHRPEGIESVAHTASALRRREGTWSGEDVDLTAIEDFDELLDVIRVGSADADLLVLFIEEDDEYLAIVRAEREDDAQVFLSDRRAAEGDGLATTLFGAEIGAPEPVDEDEESARPEVVPAGDAALLASAGIGPQVLLDLCAAEGMLPSDVIYEICERLGCADVLEEVRGY